MDVHLPLLQTRQIMKLHNGNLLLNEFLNTNHIALLQRTSAISQHLAALSL